MILTNFIDHSVYDFISDCLTYNDAVETLKSVYVKTKNEVFASHILSTHKQKSVESIDQFVQTSKVLAKDCNYKAVSANVYQEEAI